MEDIDPSDYFNIDADNEQMNSLQFYRNEFIKYAQLCGPEYIKQIDKYYEFEDYIGSSIRSICDNKYSEYMKFNTIQINPFYGLENFEARLKFIKLTLQTVKNDYDKIVKMKEMIEYYKDIVFIYDCDDYNDEEYIEIFKSYAPTTPILFQSIKKLDKQTGSIIRQFVINKDHINYWKKLADEAILHFNKRNCIE